MQQKKKARHNAVAGSQNKCSQKVTPADYTTSVPIRGYIL